MCCDQHSFVSGENEFQDVYADICKPSTGRNFNPMKQAPKSASLEGIVFDERAWLTGGNGGQGLLCFIGGGPTMLCLSPKTDTHCGFEAPF